MNRFCQHLIANEHCQPIKFDNGGEMSESYCSTNDQPALCIPELSALVSHFDNVLARTDGHFFHLYCIKDRTHRQSKVDVTSTLLKAIGKHCYDHMSENKSSGTEGLGRKMLSRLDVLSTPRLLPRQVFIYVIELVNEDDKECSHLKALQTMTSRPIIYAHQINLKSKAIWGSKLTYSLKSFYRRAITAVELPGEIIGKPIAIVDIEKQKSTLTYSLILLFIFTFIGELVNSQSVLAPSQSTLISLGGLSGNLIE